MGLSLESLVGGVRTLLGSTIGSLAGSIALGAGLLFGAAGMSGCDEEPVEVGTEESTYFEATAGNYEVALSWDVEYGDDASHLMMRRKQDTFPKDINDGDLIYEGKSGTGEIIDPGLERDVLYCYQIFFLSDRNPVIVTNYRASAIPFDNIPPLNVSNISAVPHENSIDLSWKNPIDSDFAGILIVRKVGSYPDDSSDGVIVYNGIDESFTDSSLPEDILHFYKIFAYDEVPNLSNGAIVSAVPLDGIAPGEISNVVLTPGVETIDISWDNPTDTDFAGVKIIRKVGSFPVSLIDGDLVYEGTGQSFQDTGLIEDTLYCYAVFTHDECPNFSGGAIFSGFPLDVTAPENVTGVTAVSKQGGVLLSWINPTDADFIGVKILRKTDSFPVNPNDGTLIYDGSSQSVTDSGISEDTIYYYAIYPYDDASNSASGETIEHRFDYVYALGWVGDGSNGWKTSDGATAGSDDKSFNGAYDTFVDSNGNIYVADNANHRICKWNNNGNFVGWIGDGSNGWKTGIGANQALDYQSFWNVRAVFVDTNGNIYAADLTRIAKWDANGNALGYIGGRLSGWHTGFIAVNGYYYDEVQNPADVFVDSNGDIYASDGSCRVTKWDAAGNAQGIIGGGFEGWQQVYCSTTGSGEKYFYDPRSLFVDGTHIYVADLGNHRISKWTKSGDFVGWIGGGSNGWKTGDAPAYGTDYQSFIQPLGVFLDNNGNIYVAECNRISKWDTQGNALGWFGDGQNGWRKSVTFMYGPDYQSFNSPSSVFMDQNKVLYITDSGNHRISRWQD